MATLRAAFRLALESDATLTGLATGGIYDADEMDFTGIGAGQAARETDGVTLKPFLAIRWRAATPFGPYPVGGERETVEVYAYDDGSHGYATVESIISRLKALVHDAYLSASDRDLAHAQWIYASGETPADELGGAACKFCRFSVTTVR